MSAPLSLSFTSWPDWLAVLIIVWIALEAINYLFPPEKK